MRLTASDLYSLHRPARCDLRVHLLEKTDLELAEVSPFQDLLLRLGVRHEGAYVESLQGVVDLSGAHHDDARVNETTRLVLEEAPIIYQGALEAGLELFGRFWTAYGSPDLLVRTDDGYLIRDAKLSRRINSSDHPEIIQAMQFYGWLFEETFDVPPVALEVYAGNLEIVPVDRGPRDDLFESLDAIARAKLAADEPNSAVGWTKCQACVFRTRCWDPAVERRDVAVLPDVDANLAQALYAEGVKSIADLAERFDVDELADFRRPWGKGTSRVGKKAESILAHIEAWDRGEPVVLGKLDLPASDYYAVIDLEGLPPFADDLDRIYLWGFGVFGRGEAQTMGVGAPAGDSSDHSAWVEFLQAAGAMVDIYGDVPWVHWSAYERTYLRKYVERYGDSTGVAEHIQANLVDLLPIVKSAFALPVPSYGLKAVERYVGFERSQKEYGGDWSIAKYIEAVERDDEEARLGLLREIMEYNREDLEATWSVLRWLVELAGR